NTRLDILNKIKQDENTEEEEEPQNKMTLLERLAAMSPEEDAEELKKYEDGMTIGDFMKEQEPKKSSHKTETKSFDLGDFEEEEPQDEESQEDGESKLITFLNYVIIFCILVFIVLAIFIVKQYFFS
ncbi:MAG: hypothetical protein LUG46_03530, partial [Erysipelotrichaceae bacterium]|nr:hypothetical protein [Erysipelotrichaceae bacterium]